jgi:uncharacterized metal-binding protein YceD (DUF177 family)
MKELKEFTIPFVGLKEGEHTFNFAVERSFFEHFGYEDFNSSNIQLDVLLNKKTTLLEFTLHYKGTVNVPCDITDEPYDQEVSGEYHFVVKFGHTFDDENEDLLIIPHGSHQVNIQQYVYESLVLAVPIRKVHPGVENGTMRSEILDKLEELSPKPVEDNSVKKSNTDPRWDKLKKLLTDKNN